MNPGSGPTPGEGRTILTAQSNGSSAERAAPVNEEPDFDTFPTLDKGNKYEDFSLDQTLTHHWGRTLTQADNVSFSTATCAWLPLHLNLVYARSQGHPDTVMNPMLVLCTAVGLSVEDLSESGGPFLGIDDCRFLRPVYPGDTITARSRVVDMRLSASKPGIGIVTWRTTASNQRGEDVLELVRTNLVAKRDVTTTTAREGIEHAT